MQWKMPPIIKIYEALGAIADGRVEKISDTEANVYSSSRGKYYLVKYDPETNAIIANDNGTYYVGYLGYPAISFLMMIGRIQFDKSIAEGLKDILWKDLNNKFNHDFGQTIEYVTGVAEARGVKREVLENEVKNILKQVESLELKKLGKKNETAGRLLMISTNYEFIRLSACGGNIRNTNYNKKSRLSRSPMICADSLSLKGLRIRGP